MSNRKVFGSKTFLCDACIKTHLNTSALFRRLLVFCRLSFSISLSLPASCPHTHRLSCAQRKPFSSPTSRGTATTTRYTFSGALGRPRRRRLTQTASSPPAISVTSRFDSSYLASIVWPPPRQRSPNGFGRQRTMIPLMLLLGFPRRGPAQRRRRSTEAVSNLSFFQRAASTTMNWRRPCGRTASSCALPFRPRTATPDR